MDIIDAVEKEVKEKIKEYKLHADDHFDYWNEHIKYVYKEAQDLASQYGADMEIVKLGALLHDIAMICEVGTKKDHHINGKIIAEEMLKKYNYPEEKLNRVLSCIYNHRSSKNATNIEDLCVADADIIAHFNNIPMLFDMAFNIYKINLNDVRNWMKDSFEKDYNDLSDKTKENFKDRYKQICEIVLGEY